MKNSLLGLIFLISLIGCATPSFKPYENQPDKWVTENIAIISDTQIHENKGESNRILGKAGDKAVPVTLRPAQQTIGAAEMLKRVIQDIPEETPIIHLGDATDISCITEWEMFVEKMDTATQEWVFVPGNHDGYLAGNLHPVYGGEQIIKRDQWYQLCNKGRHYNMDPTPQRILDKNTLISKYLMQLSKMYADLTIEPNHKNGTILLNEGSFLKGVAWKIDNINPWRSYIIQIVSLPPAKDSKRGHYILLFDTANYLMQPSTAGVRGGISREQLQDGYNLLSKIPAGSTYSFAGHHPFNELKYKKWDHNRKEMFDRMLTGRDAIPFYISSHTHKGYWKDHNAENYILTELNVGSINDSPSYYRNLKLGIAKNDEHIIDSKINDLMEIYSDNICAGTILPTDNEPHSIENQDTDNWLSAVYYFFAFWKSKHDEIEPELFVYRDLLLEFVPADTVHFLYYDWDDDNKTLTTRTEILSEIDNLYDCNKKDCPERQKARFIIALDHFIETNTDNPQGLHDRMACLSLMAAEEDAGKLHNREIRKQIHPERISIKSH